MHICFVTFAGISLRLCSISLRSFRFGYAPFRFAHFASVMLHFASLISHNLRCIPAYTHQIPMGFFQFWEILPFLFWKGVFAPILAKFLVSLHSKIRTKLDNELLMNLLAVTLGKS